MEMRKGNKCVLKASEEDVLDLFPTPPKTSMVWKDDYVLHELLADRSNILAEGGAEHHHLLAVWSTAENLLNVFPHI